MPALPMDSTQIVITASRAPQSEAQTPASVTIVDQQRIERLDEPLLSALLRLTPSAAIATSGPRGSLTEARIRGAEATTHCCSSTELRLTTLHRATRRGTKFST